MTQNHTAGTLLFKQLKTFNESAVYWLYAVSSGN